MLKTVIVAENPLDPRSWESYEIEDVVLFLRSRFPIWPSSARIYHGSVAESCDVTPVDEATADLIPTLDGTIYVVVYPAGVAILITIVAVAAAIAAAYFFKPKIPSVTEASADASRSVNNSISERKNTARPKERIPDILGVIRATPDLIAVPYRIFKFNDEYEYSYMCLGRGSYEVSDLREDKTLLGSDVSVRVFGPGTSPNGGSPQLSIGDPVSEGVATVVRHSSVNDQILRPPNLQFPTIAQFDLYHGARAATWVRLTVTNLPGESLRDYFWVGGNIELHTRQISAHVQPYYDLGYYNLNGTYVVSEVTDTTLTFQVDSSDVRWNTYFHDAMTGVPPTYTNECTNPPVLGAGNHFGNGTDSIVEPDLKWVGPFRLDAADATQVLSNYVAERGLFQDSGTTRTAVSVTIRLEITPVDVNGTAIGVAQSHETTLSGSSSRVITKRGVTQKIDLNPTGRYSVRAARTTNTALNYDGSVVDEVTWRDLYGLSPVAVADFGDVTTVQLVTRSNPFSASTTRKFNLLAARKIPTWDGAAFTGLTATSRADEILPFVCLDAAIGGRALSEIDVVGIRAIIAAVEAYFGHERAVEFNYSFDDSNISFEETVETIASAAFCTAYRRGSQIKLSFERSANDSVLLFNHRNKIPGTESRTVRFGVLDDNDGVEYTYVDANGDDDSAKLTLYLPADQSAVKAKKVESAGVTNRLQAYFHAWRIWNKIRYQNTIVEFTATQEANLLLLNDRILVADNTRPNTQDGEILAQNVLELTLSREVTFAVGSTYHIFLQHTDGSVESIPCTAGSLSRKIVLSRAPAVELSLDPEAYARTIFLMVKDGDSRRETPFLVTERDLKDGGYTATVKAVNYDSRYYNQDQAFILHIVDENGILDPLYEDAYNALVGSYGTDEAAGSVLDALAHLLSVWPG
jgi:hypothetical protein